MIYEKSSINKELFCAIGEHSVDAYFIYKIKDHKFTYLNQAFEQIWELSLAEVWQSPELLIAQVHIEDKEHVKDCYEECLEEFKPKKYEFRICVADGTEKHIRISIYPLKWEDEIIIAGIAEDNTAIKHNKIHIEQINARKNTTLEILSHDLKEPLGMMKMAASAIENEVKETGSDYMLKLLRFIQDMCERNILFIRSLINYEFLKSAEIEIKKERAELVSEIRDVLQFYKRSRLSDVKNFEFSSSVDKLYLNIDSMKFLQVINNLISNSIKFTADGGYIKIHIEDHHTKVLVTVSDNGIGIPDHLKPHLFDKLHQALRPGLKGEESGGLGMGIIKAIVELHRGKIWFESEENAGTKFFIELPK
ncbi:PAS domain-containing sensor histidine kinase [Pedobacter punctiformis]|uniref:histidine kinase n=1 Tax=Pedobacter punctiformis TaxID=3004097 RepID=A0ABT4L855_9SPHI|nr:PAS domain-containing sensor histidine kinase [Pedobacter sp. HCMS5-2]MCZ4244075.1 PAS domain-containing sensor histidine kinase [Pedobacter sp. HCMS5-2]